MFNISPHLTVISQADLGTFNKVSSISPKETLDCLPAGKVLRQTVKHLYLEHVYLAVINFGNIGGKGIELLNMNPPIYDL